MASAGWRDRQIHFVCAYCLADFSVRPSRVAAQRSSVKFCSRHCKDESQVMARTEPFACSQCGGVKMPEEFYIDNAKRRGRVAACKDCYATKSSNVVRFKPYRREGSLRAGATRRGLSYELTREQFMSLWRLPCSYCGEVIQTIGVDRVDNNVGYTADNVVPCCAICNAMKSNMSVTAFIERCRRITEMDANSAITHDGKY